MMINLSKTVLLITITATLAACVPASTALPTPSAAPSTLPRPLQSEADVPRVSSAEALAAFESGEAIIVDVRSTEAFAAEHIQGASSIPLAGIEEDPTNLKLDSSKWIITYCT